MISTKTYDDFKRVFPDSKTTEEEFDRNKRLDKIFLFELNVHFFDNWFTIEEMIELEKIYIESGKNVLLEKYKLKLKEKGLYSNDDEKDRGLFELNP